MVMIVAMVTVIDTVLDLKIECSSLHPRSKSHT